MPRNKTRVAYDLEQPFSGRHDLFGDDFLFAGANYLEDGLAASSKAAPTSSTIALEQPGKIGIGTWDIDASGTALDDLGRFDFGWYYNWQAEPLWTPDDSAISDKGFVPMIWGADNVNASDLAAAEASSSRHILGFNEPDNANQADLSVAEALRLWPKLMDTGKLLGSPATTMSETLGADSWLGRFLDRADEKGYDVDFVAVHYYSDDGSVRAFKNFLQDVRAEYHKPVWVTEWALVDWNDPDRFSDRQIANFAEKSVEMLDGLDFVKRHAWFAAYSGGGGWDINTELIDNDGQLTKVGETFADLTL